MTEHQSTYLLAYTGIVAFAILIEAIAIVILALAAAKLMKQVTALTQEAKGKVYPILESVRDIAVKGQEIALVARNVAADSEPKIKRVTTNIAETTDVYRAKLAQVDSLISDTAQKAQKQTARVDDLISSTLAKTENIATSVQSAVLAPFRQASGLFEGIKVGIESLLHKSATERKTPKPVAFEGDSIYTGREDDYHA
ncbi:MAG: hypothetical protein ACRYF4_14030 [Janthinobacterium lividum]